MNELTNITFVYSLPAIIDKDKQQSKRANYVVVIADGAVYENKNNKTGMIERKDLKFIKRLKDLNGSAPLGKYILEEVSKCKQVR